MTFKGTRIKGEAAMFQMYQRILLLLLYVVAASSNDSLRGYAVFPTPDLEHEENKDEKKVPTPIDSLISRRSLDIWDAPPPKLMSAHRFIDKDGLGRCRQNVFAAEESKDMLLSPEEFALFIAYESNGSIMRPFKELPLVLITTYYAVACTQCYKLTKDDTCCMGDSAFIDLSGEGLFGATTEFLCSVVIDLMEDLTKYTPPPTPPEGGSPAPTVPQSPVPSVPPSPTPSKSPTDSPTTKKPVTQPPTKPPTKPPVLPSQEPSSMPTKTPTKTPSTVAPTDQSPATKPPKPSVTPSQAPTTGKPTTVKPTTSSPTKIPTKEPTLTKIPTMKPSDEPSNAPSMAPSSAPSENNLLCINFYYTIQNSAGLSADDIMLEVNNTLKTGLELATKNITIQILNETNPRDEGGNRQRLLSPLKWFEEELKVKLFRDDPPASNKNDSDNEEMDVYSAVFEGRGVRFNSGVETAMSKAMAPLFDDTSRMSYVLNSFMTEVYGVPQTIPEVDDDGNRRSLIQRSAKQERIKQRKLVYYTDVYPVKITNVIDDPFCPESVGMVLQVKCAIIVSDVCVVLEEGDNPVKIRLGLTAGLEGAVRSGAFFEAVPPKHIP